MSAWAGARVGGFLYRHAVPRGAEMIAVIFIVVVMLGFGLLAMSPLFEEPAERINALALGEQYDTI